ncbi:MAG: M48 family metallopeptidase [Lacipirellulaceae bacterium]
MNDRTPSDATTPTGRVPTRPEAFARVERANAIDGWVIGALLCAAVVLAAVARWPAVIAAPATTLVVAGVLLVQEAAALVRLVGTKRKRIEEVRVGVKLGAYDRDSLVALVHDVEDRLGVPRGRYNVYVTRDKSLNAGALTSGIGSLVSGVDGVYLHRQLLHVLEPDELSFVIAHELGHCHRHYLRSTRAWLLNLLVCTLAVLALLPFAERYGWMGVFGVAIGGFYLNSVLAGRGARQSKTIEHLCDDYGAIATGVPQAVNALLKIGAEFEASERVTRYCLEIGKAMKDIDPFELMRRYQEAMPFGSLNREESERLLTDSLRRVEQDNRSLSLRGYWDYLSDSDARDEAAAELRKELRRLDEVEVIDWGKSLRESGERRMTESAIDAVVESLEAKPEAALFRSTGELDSVPTHPTTRARVIYLWRNRAAIEAAARSLSIDPPTTIRR